MGLSREFKVERQYDHIYDPNYCVTSTYDHTRAYEKAGALVQRLYHIPIFRNMFSELKNHKAFQIRSQNDRFLPTNQGLDWKGCSQYNYFLEEVANNKHASVNGRERCNYFARPPFISPYMSSEYALARRTFDNDFMSDPSVGPRLISRSIQTMYRDSEVQTNPYSPEYTIRVGDKPEVLFLTNLKFDQGLPAGQKEVEMIERMRERRVMQIELVKADDMGNHKEAMSLRKAMLTKVELEEWVCREKEIEDLQEIRLQVIAQLLRSREENHQEIVSHRLDRLWIVRQKHHNSTMHNIRREYAAAIRKLLREVAKSTNKVKKDKISQYANPGSQCFAPLTRNGVFHDRGADQYKVKSRFLDTYSGILELERSLPDQLFESKFRFNIPSQYTKNGYLKRAYRWQRELADLHKHMLENPRKKKLPFWASRFVEKIEKPVQRPATPSVPDMNQLMDDREIAVLQLQRLLRGRAVQAMMYESRSKRQLLIDELRSTHALVKEDRAEQRRQMLTTRANQTCYKTLQHEDHIAHEVLTRLESRALGDMLDFLSKELDRLVMERKVHAFAVIAQRERRMREADESGRRQREERRRREIDEVFRQTIKVHQETVDGYFKQLTESTMESTADVKARAEMDEVASHWVQDLRRWERRFNAEEEASDLVHNFLIPEVTRRAYRDQLKRDERTYLNAAHLQIFEEAREGRLTDQIREPEDAPRSRSTDMLTPRPDYFPSPPSSFEEEQ